MSFIFNGLLEFPDGTWLCRPIHGGTETKAGMELPWNVGQSNQVQIAHLGGLTNPASTSNLRVDAGRFNEADGLAEVKNVCVRDAR